MNKKVVSLKRAAEDITKALKDDRSFNKKEETTIGSLGASLVSSLAQWRVRKKKKKR
ncbi:MAG: hypothetical protein JSU59_06395 [Nitrospirota bacterium]|nr:MAG: hypothetical protein JSU59_06395 [Nitrospirota bacterium]